MNTWFKLYVKLHVKIDNTIVLKSSVSTMNSQEAYSNACHIISEWISKNNPDEILNLSYMSLRSVPPIPNNVRILDISYNKLITLPELPSSIHILLCNSNYIRKMECIPAHIHHINISNNMLIYKPYKISIFTTVLCRGNPFLFDYLDDSNYEEYIMDLRYSEGIVRTLLDGL